MSGIMENIVNKYNYLVYDLADPRSHNWFLVSSPLTILSILAAYLYFCISLGPRLMKNREPYELKTTLLIYNAFQVCFSLYLVYLGTVYVLHKDYSLACEGIDYSNKPRAIQNSASTWFYFIAKITELLDTLFFVLRKKYNQVSFLHVYHHVLMVLFVWLSVKYSPGGQGFLMGYLNSIVHVIMYTYYLVSGLGPQYQKYIWWKKHVTIIQLVGFIIFSFFHNIQFGIVFVHQVYGLYFSAIQCDFPKAVSFIITANSLAFIYMFGNFYIKNYNKESQTKLKLEAKHAYENMSKKINNNYSLKGREREIGLKCKLRVVDNIPT